MHEIGRKEALKRAGHGMDRSKAIGSGRMEQDWTWRAPKERSSVYGAYGTDGGGDAPGLFFFSPLCSYKGGNHGSGPFNVTTHSPVLDVDPVPPSIIRYARDNPQIVAARGEST